MTTGVVKTQRTELFLVDRLTVPATPALVKLACPTGITGLGGAADQIEDTCLDNAGDKSYQRGLGNPGLVTVPFNMIPSSASHQLLFALKTAGTIIDWAVALSESTTAPTLSGTPDYDIVPATDRTQFLFQGYIADVNIDIATNEIVRGTLTVQRSGSVTPTWYTP
jgi:hypothetical protein